MNKSGDTTNSQEIWKCYKPEYHYGSTQDWNVDHLRCKERHNETISCKNLGHYRCCLINGILNEVAPLQLCRCQFTEILLHMHLKLVYGVGHILGIRIISYMEISTYFHLLCNYSQNYLLIRNSPPTLPPKKIPTTCFHSQKFSCLQ